MNIMSIDFPKKETKEKTEQIKKRNEVINELAKTFSSAQESIESISEYTKLSQEDLDRGCVELSDFTARDWKCLAEANKISSTLSELHTA